MTRIPVRIRPCLGRLLLPLGLTVAAQLIAGLAVAATFDVDTVLDSADPAYALCQAGPVDCSLRGAVTAANANPGADVITLPFGIYSITVGAAGEDGNLEGDLDVTGDLLVDGPGGVIDGAGLDRVFDVHGADLELRHLLIAGGLGSGLLAEGGALRHDGGTVTLHNVTLQSNEAALGGAVFQRSGHLVIENGSRLWQNVSRDAGGALYVAAGTVAITDSRVESNQADGHGGAIAFYGATLDITRSDLATNATTAAFDGDGGAIYAAAGAVTIVGSELRANVAEYPGADFGRGGAIALQAEASLDVVSSELVENESGYHGGALYSDGRVTLIDVHVTDNVAVHRGGGLAISSGSATLLRTTVTGNVAARGGAIYSQALVEIEGGVLSGNAADLGGAIFNDGDDTAATLTVLDSVLTGNLAETSGGAVFNVSGLAVATMFGTEVSNNEASDGGGLANVGNASGAPHLEVRQCEIIGNRAIDFVGWGYAGSGGGLSNLHATASIYASEVIGNTADLMGGGIVSTGGVQPALLIFNRSLAADNAAGGSGGGLWIAGAGDDQTESRAVLNNSTISTNIAEDLGGGIFAMENESNPAPVEVYLYNVTVAGNQGLSGPGDALFAHRGSDIHVANSIVATQGQPDCAWAFGGAVHTRGHNIESDLSCGFVQLGDQRNTAPLLDPLADYGGPTRTHRLQPTSPAVDAGDPSGCDADRDGDGLLDSAPLGGDQRSVMRQGLCDVGAYERPPAL